MENSLVWRRTGGTGRLFYAKMSPRCRSCFQWTVLVLRDARMGQRRRQMCRNIKTLFDFEPPATEDEIHASALQFVRKLSGFNNPSQANAEAVDRAVAEVTASAQHLLASLHTQAPARDREIEAEKAKERSRLRFG